MAGEKRSLYKPAYCNEIIQYLAEGHTLKAFAGHIGVGLRTVYDWIKRYEDFAEAHEIAEAKSLCFWEDRLIASANGENKDAAPSVLIFGVKNRGAEHWRDVQKVEVGKPGEFSGMTDEELDQFISREQGAIGISARGEEKARNEEKAGRSRRLN